MYGTHIVVVYDGHKITASYGPFLDKGQADRWGDKWVCNRHWSAVTLVDPSFVEN